jgi:hypothetical protein
MTDADHIADALAQAKRRLENAKAEYNRHLEWEPNEPHAAARHAHVTRKLADDIATAAYDCEVLTRELTRAAHSDAQAILP